MRVYADVRVWAYRYNRENHVTQYAAYRKWRNKRREANGHKRKEHKDISHCCEQMRGA